MPWKVINPPEPVMLPSLKPGRTLRDHTKCPHERVTSRWNGSGFWWECQECGSHVRTVHEIKQTTFIFDVGDNASPRFVQA